MSFIAQHKYIRHGADTGYDPTKHLLYGWTVEGSFSKPIVSGEDTLSKTYLTSGSTIDFPLYVYSSTLTDYDEATSTWSDGEMRFTLNIKVDTALPEFPDEIPEMINFKGVYDGTNPIFKFEQCTTGSQTWAS